MTPEDAGKPPARRARRDGNRDLRRFTDPIPDALVLAAVERAQSDSPHQDPGAVMSRIAAHLGYIPSAWTTRNVRPQMEQLTADGQLHRTRRHGVLVWAITPAGRRRLAQAKRRGQVALPESPQHREWRYAREEATDRLHELRQLFDSTLADASSLLETEAADSLSFLRLAGRLRQTCWQLGSAIYCLREWPEPDDSRPGHARFRVGDPRTGITNTLNWKDADELHETPRCQEPPTRP